MSATRPLHFGGRVGRHNQRNDSRQQQQHNAAASHPLLARRWLPPNTLHHYTAACVSAGSGSHPGATVWWWCVQMLPCPCCQECGGGCVSVVPVVVRGRGYLAWPSPPSATLAINNMMRQPGESTRQCYLTKQPDKYWTRQADGATMKNLDGTP